MHRKTNLWMTSCWSVFSTWRLIHKKGSSIRQVTKKKVLLSDMYYKKRAKTCQWNVSDTWHSQERLQHWRVTSCPFPVTDGPKHHTVVQSTAGKKEWLGMAARHYAALDNIHQAVVTLTSSITNRFIWPWKRDRHGFFSHQNTHSFWIWLASCIL